MLDLPPGGLWTFTEVFAACVWGCWASCLGAYLGAYLGTYLGCSAGFWACWGWFFGGAGLSSPNTIDDWLWYFAGLEEDCTFLGWLWGLVVAPSQGEVALAARSVVDLDGGFVRLPDIALVSFH